MTPPRVKTVFVLGHRGMLGHVVARFFRERGARVLTTETRFDPAATAYVDEVASAGADVVINCVGAIKQNHQDAAALYGINTLLPVQLCQRLSTRMLHPSTDCVFAGTRGDYAVDAPHDATDAYGISKSLGEIVARSPSAMVIRTSIIGPDSSGGGRGLMAWFLAQKDSAPGFINHRWNGITTLQWAELAWEIVDGKRPFGGVVQPGGDAVTKAQLLRLIARTHHHDVEVRDVEAPDAVDRTLRPTVRCPPLEDQLARLHAWSST